MKHETTNKKNKINIKIKQLKDDEIYRFCHLYMTILNEMKVKECFTIWIKMQKSFF